MNHFEWNWVQEGLKIYAQGWNPPQTKGVVCIVHGFNEHSSRYEHVAIRLCNAGYAVLTYDEFGHGKTEGKRGHAPSYQALLNSVKIILDEAENRFPGVRKFLWGHSMGGAIVINYLEQNNPRLVGGQAHISGAVATSPLFRLAFKPNPIKVFLARIMKSIFPKFTEKANLDSNAISRDKEEVRKYNTDPYNHNRITAGFFWGIHTGGENALQHAAVIKVPLLLMHGTADRLTSFEASKEFAAKAPADLVTFKIWEGYYHELHNEPEPYRTEAINYIINWLDGRV